MSTTATAFSTTLDYCKRSSGISLTLLKACPHQKFVTTINHIYVDYDPNLYTFFGYFGITAALVFCNMGAAYGTARSGVGICQVGIIKSDMVFKSLLPIIMAGILGIYGLIVSVIL